MPAQSTPACPYCGNNPVSHVMTRTSEYLSMVNRPLEWLSISAFGRAIERVLHRLAVPLLWLAAALGIVRFNDDHTRAATDRSLVIWEEAQRRGIPMRQIVLFGRFLDFYVARVRGRTIIFESLPIPTRLQTNALRWMDDKLKLKKKLAAAGIPVAQGGAFFRFAGMRKLFASVRKPVIVKPALGSRGRHTTTFIFTEDQLRQAFAIGKQITTRLVMEEHLTGSVYRGTVIANRLVGVLRGDPPRITGDGTSTIRALIAEKNAKRHKKVKEYRVTPLTESFLARNNYTLDTVLPAGVVIDLTEKIGISYGGFSAEEFPICHPKIKETLEAAGRVVNFPIMGFDFIIGDITKDPDEQVWGIIECNSLPFIDLHHHPLEGTPINAAASVWDLWEQ